MVNFITDFCGFCVFVNVICLCFGTISAADLFNCNECRVLLWTTVYGRALVTDCVNRGYLFDL